MVRFPWPRLTNGDGVVVGCDSKCEDRALIWSFRNIVIIREYTYELSIFRN